ncbi:hypothetical protein WN48_00574 [Eufriesea mexicana]|nr:hypothetical protein WN48_00574 [Eufriesea mexicana]
MLVEHERMAEGSEMGIESDTVSMIESQKGLGNKVPANFLKSARGSVTAVGPRCLESGRCNSGQTSLNTIPSAPSYFQNVLRPALLSDTRREEEEREACGSFETVG